MRELVWCSPHTPTEEQLKELKEMGSVVFLKDERPDLQERLANCPSDRKELDKLARDVFKYLGEDRCAVQLGGSPLFLYIAGSIRGGHMDKKTVLFAHSQRVSEDVPQADGTIKKVSTFKHLGFI